jgi:thioredoxin reductase (NADPH)
MIDERVLLTEAKLVRLRAAGELRRFAAGEVLLEPGERRYPFLLLGEGRAEVVRFATPDRPEMVLDRLGPGDFVGEWGLITGEAAFLAARAIQPGLLYEIPRERFMEVISEDGELSSVIMREFLRRRDLLRAGEGAGSVEILGGARPDRRRRRRAALRRPDDRAHPAARRTATQLTLGSAVRQRPRR